MLRLLFFVLIVGALMFGAAWIFENDTALEIRWFDGRVYDWTLAWLVVAGVALVVATIVIYELLRLVLGFPVRWWRKRKANRHLRGMHTVARGMMAVAGGDVTQAKELRREADRLLGEHEPAALLLASQSAEVAGEHEVAQLKFRQMLRHKPTTLVGLRGLMNDAIAAGDSHQALEYARRAYKEYPYTEWVVETLFDLLVQQHNWSEALRRIDDLKLNRVIDAEEAQRRRSVVRLLMAKDRAAEGALEDAFNSAMEATRRQRAFAPAAAYAAELARGLNRNGPARTVVEEAWARAPHPLLLEAYKALGPDEHPRSWLGRLERLYNRNNSHHLTLRAMVEASLAADDKPRAVGFARSVPNSNPTVSTIQAAIDAHRASNPDAPEIAELEALLASAPQDEAWVCQVTGQVVPEWQPFGPRGDFDSLRWQSPPRVATYVASAPGGTFEGPAVDLEPEPSTAR